MEQTQTNIAVIMDQLGQTISHQQIDFYDAIDNTTYPITLWAFFFYLKYYYIQMDDPNKYSETITFFLKNYMSYDDWISKTNNEVYESTEQSITMLNTTITICIIVQIIVFMLNTMLLIGCAYSYLQLIKRLIRCCQQISYLSLIFDLEYYDELLSQFTYKQDSNLCYFNLYDHHTDYQDKFRLILKQDVENTKQSDPTQLKHQMAFKMHLLGSKQNLTIKEKLNCKTQIFIPLNLFCSSIFLIAFVASMIDLVQFKTSLDLNIKIFSQIVIIQEQFLQITLSNSVINDEFHTVLNETELMYYSDLQQTSWNQYHQLMNDLLVYDSEISFRFTNKLNDKLCKDSLCGFDIAFQNALTSILKHISENEFKGYKFEQDDIAIISQIQVEFLDFLDESEAWLKAQSQSQYDFTLLMLVLLGVLMFIIQIIQSIITHQYLNNRFQQVKQFVYQIPTCTLYLEDSFYKTIQYISLKERLLVD